jgi:Holliday junction resolvasome RuvABC endonuclease subunit
MNVLILDPAMSTGYCFVTVDNNIATITGWGFLDISPETHNGLQYSQYLETIKKMIVDNSIDLVGKEDYFFSKFASQGANLNCANRAMIELACATAYSDRVIPYETINISLWKKFINNGHSRPTKEQIKLWGKEPAKKLMTQEALYNNFNIRFPNHSISNATGKPIKFRYDIVDAVAMAIFLCSIYLRVQQIIYAVPTIQDIEWKKIPSGTFLYK